MSFQDVIEVDGPLLPPRKELHLGRLNPTQAISASIFEINTLVLSFNRLLDTLGTRKDTPDLRRKLHKTGQHISHLAKDISGKLKAAGESDRSSEIHVVEKIANAKLTKDFQAVLKEFQKAQRIAAEREATYGPFVPQVVSPSSFVAGEFNMKPEEDRHTQEQWAVLMDQRRHEVILIESDLISNEALIEERDQGIKEIQQQIGEVNEIFKDLAILVREQGVMLDDIDSNLQNTHSATVQANQQLSEASKSQKSKNSLACLLLVILGVALLIVLIMLAA